MYFTISYSKESILIKNQIQEKVMEWNAVGNCMGVPPNDLSFFHPLVIYESRWMDALISKLLKFECLTEIDYSKRDVYLSLSIS